MVPTVEGVTQKSASTEDTDGSKEMSLPFGETFVSFVQVVKVMREKGWGWKVRMTWSSYLRMKSFFFVIVSDNWYIRNPV